MSEIVCRNCGSDSIASFDEYIGTCLGQVTINKRGTLEFQPGGYTEIAWDSCQQTGWQCRSCFTLEVIRDTGDDLNEALLRLVTTPDDVEPVLPEPLTEANCPRSSQGKFFCPVCLEGGRQVGYVTYTSLTRHHALKEHLKCSCGWVGLSHGSHVAGLERRGKLHGEHRIVRRGIYVELA